MSINNESALKQLLTDYPILLERFISEDSALTGNLLQEVDESNFSLADWVESLVVLDKWLDAENLSLLPEDSLGYVSCAAKSVENSAALTHLPSLVEDFLKQYGCERAIKK